MQESQANKAFFNLTQLTSSMMLPLGAQIEKCFNQTQMWTMEKLFECEMLYLSQIAKKIQVSNQVMTRATEALVEEGYVERLDNRGDRRQILVKLTPKGKSLMEAYHKEIQTEMREYFRDFSPEECEKLRYHSQQLSELLLRSGCEYGKIYHQQVREAGLPYEKTMEKGFSQG